MSDGVDTLLLKLYRGSTQVAFARFKDWALDLLGGAVRFDGAWWGKATSRPDKIVSVHVHNADPAIIDDYRAIDPVDFFRDAMLAKPGTTINLYDLISRRDYVRSGMYTRYGRKHKLEAVMGTVCVEPVTSMVEFLTIWRVDARWPFSEADRQRIERLTPHLFEGNRISLRLSLQADKRIALPAADAMRPWALVSVEDGCLVEVDGSFVDHARREWPTWYSAKLPDELRRCLLGCETYFGRQLTIYVSDADDRRLLVVQPKHPAMGLGAREAEVLRRYAHGETYKEIARQLGTSPATVRNQIARLYRRFDVHNKVELIRAVDAAGPLEADPVKAGSPAAPLPLDALLAGDDADADALDGPPPPRAPRNGAATGGPRRARGQD